MLRLLRLLLLLLLLQLSVLLFGWVKHELYCRVWRESGFLFPRKVVRIQQCNRGSRDPSINKTVVKATVAKVGRRVACTDARTAADVDLVGCSLGKRKCFFQV